MRRMHPNRTIPVVAITLFRQRPCSSSAIGFRKPTDCSEQFAYYKLSIWKHEAPESFSIHPIPIVRVIGPQTRRCATSGTYSSTVSSAGRTKSSTAGMHTKSAATPDPGPQHHSPRSSLARVSQATHTTVTETSSCHAGMSMGIACVAGIETGGGLIGMKTLVLGLIVWGVAGILWRMLSFPKNGRNAVIGTWSERDALAGRIYLDDVSDTSSMANYSRSTVSRPSTSVVGTAATDGDSGVASIGSSDSEMYFD